MQRTILSILTIGFLLFGPLSTPQAQERAEGGRSPELQRETEHLHKRLQDFQALQRRLKEADGPAEELAEVQSQIVRTERELDEIQAQRANRQERRPELREHAERLELATRRIHHIRVAAENLEAAELHDIADELRKKAGSMERDVQQAKKRLAAEMKRSQDHREGEEVRSVVHELREEVERLRAEVKELRRQIER